MEFVSLQKCIHTAANIAAIIKPMTQSWMLTDRLHIVLRDNGKNMVKGIMDAGLLSAGSVIQVNSNCN